MEIADHALDPIVDPAEPGVIGCRRAIVDDRIDQGARRLRFLLDFQTPRLIDFPLIRHGGLIGRRLHPADHQPAQRQRLLQRMDVHPRQMPIRLDILGTELVELVGNLARHHCR
jgi:hypothetical protein